MAKANMRKCGLIVWAPYYRVMKMNFMFLFGKVGVDIIDGKYDDECLQYLICQNEDLSAISRNHAIRSDCRICTQLG